MVGFTACAAWWAILPLEGNTNAVESYQGFIEDTVMTRRERVPGVARAGSFGGMLVSSLFTLVLLPSVLSMNEDAALTAVALVEASECPKQKSPDAMLTKGLLNINSGVSSR